jgi:hypothetical protein
MDIVAIITTLLTICVAIVQSVLVKKINDTLSESKLRKQKLEERDKNLEDGVMALLGDAIDRQCKLAVNEEDVEAMKVYIAKIDHLNKPYQALGGNGVIATEIKSVNEIYHYRLTKSTNN